MTNALNFARINKTNNEHSGVYAVASVYGSDHLEQALTKLNDRAGSVTYAITGHYPAHAYMIHTGIQDIQNLLWSSSHWNAISLVYDKDINAKHAMELVLKAKEQLSELHTSSLKCYTSNF